MDQDHLYKKVFHASKFQYELKAIIGMRLKLKKYEKFLPGHFPGI
jgi:hypothetical protein